MSAPPEESDAERDQRQQKALAAALFDSLDTSDRISLAAVATAAIALIVGIVQTGFMWVSRNDEVEAALRAEQVRACVAYRITAVDANERAQMIAADGEAPVDGAEFERVMNRYRTAIGELRYLLPARDGEALTGADAAAVDAYNSFLNDDFKSLAAVSRASGAWSTAHDSVLEACERVIRDVRDR